MASTGVSLPSYATWEPLGLENEHVVELSSNGEYVFAVTQDASYWDRSLWRLRIDGTGTPEQVWDSANGSSWSVACHPLEPDTVYIGLATGLEPLGGPLIHRSVDGGATFAPFSDGLCVSDPAEHRGVWALSASATSPSLLVAGASDQLYYAASGAAGWVPGSLPGGSCACAGGCVVAHGVARGVSDPSVLVVAFDSLCLGSETWRSADAGTTWSNVYLECDAIVDVLAIDPTNAERMYRTRRGLAFRSVDGGETWAKMPLPFGAEGFAIDAMDPSILYGASHPDISWSPDRGVSWNAIDVTGLPPTGNQTAFTAGAMNQGLLLIGFESGGIFRKQISVSSVAVNDPALVPPGSPQLLAAPNPFRHTTTLRLVAGVASRRARVSIYDAAGRLVRRLDPGSGTHSRSVVRWDGRDETGAAVTSGVYFATLPGGGATRLVKLR